MKNLNQLVLAFLEQNKTPNGLKAFWNLIDGQLSAVLGSILTKFLPKADADYEDVLQEAKWNLFNVLKKNKYDPKKSNLTNFAASILIRKRVDSIRRKVRDNNKINKLIDTSKTRKDYDFPVQNEAIFNDYLDRWHVLKNQLPESTRLILAEIGFASSKDIMNKHKLTSVQYCRLLKKVRAMIEETIFSGSKI